jgi:hypothetical protein
MSERVCWACDRPAIVGYDLAITAPWSRPSAIMATVCEDCWQAAEAVLRHRRCRGPLALRRPVSPPAPSAEDREG